MNDTTTQTTDTATDKKLQDEIRESAHKIWLAGLGALAAAEEEGSKLFSRLVDRGRDMESKGKENVKEGVGKAREAASSTLSDVGRSLDETVTSALHRFGVPTRDEIRTLTQRVEELNAKVEQLRPKTTASTTIVTPAEAATPAGGTGPIETPETPEPAGDLTGAGRTSKKATV